MGLNKLAIYYNNNRMSKNSMDNLNDIPKKPRGRPRKWENNTKIRDNLEYYRTYQRNYYREKLSMVVKCPKCNRDITKQKLRRRQTSYLCARNEIKDSVNPYREVEETDLSSENEEGLEKKGWYKED